MKSLIIISILLSVSSLMSSCHVKARNEKILYSMYVENQGLPAWDSEEWSAVDVVQIEGTHVESENTMKVFSRWNHDSLYFFFKVVDACLRSYQTEQDHPQLFLDDMVELLLDTQNHKDSCWSEDDIVYHINLHGVKKDDRGREDCTSDPSWNGSECISVALFGTLNDTTDTDQGYIISLTLPWTDIERGPYPGLSMGVNVANGDNDGKGRQLFDWVGAWPLRSPYAFGNLVLRKQK